MAISLPDLPDEIIFLILEIGRLDTLDALALRQICRRLHDISLTPSYFLCIANNLDRQLPLPSEPRLSELSVEELKELCAIRQKSIINLSLPEPKYKRAAVLPLPDAEGGDHVTYFAALDAGSQAFILYNAGLFELWSLPVWLPGTRGVMVFGFKYVWGPIFNHDAIRNRIKTQLLAQSRVAEDVSEDIVMSYITETVCRLADEEDRPFSTIKGYPLDGSEVVGRIVFVHAAGNDKEVLENTVKKLQLRPGLQRVKEEYGVVDDPQIWEVRDVRGGYFYKDTYEDVDDWGPRGSRLVQPSQQSSNLD